MAEYMERSKVIELLKGTEVNGTPYMKRIVKATVDLAIEAISDDVPADVVPAKRAHWIPNKWTQTRNQLVSCSRCGREASYPGENYCPNCGAEMEVKDNAD